MKIAQGMSGAAHECRNIFKPAEIINAFQRGFPEETRERGLKLMLHRPIVDLNINIVVCKISIKASNTKRVLMNFQKASETSKSSRIVSRTKPSRPVKISAVRIYDPAVGVSEFASPPSTASNTSLSVPFQVPKPAVTAISQALPTKDPFAVVSDPVNFEDGWPVKEQTSVGVLENGHVALEINFLEDLLHVME